MKPKFRAGQIACIIGLEMPCGAVRIKLLLSRDMWLGTVEQDGKLDDREFTSGDLRQLTAREIGLRPKRGKA